MQYLIRRVVAFMFTSDGNHQEPAETILSRNICGDLICFVILFLKKNLTKSIFP